MNRERVLSPLRDLSAEKPATKMGQIRWAWPEIQAALAAGHTLRSVHRCLDAIGIAIGYRTLSLYIGRLEREQALAEPTAAAQPRKTGSPAQLAVPIAPVAAGRREIAEDPFANIRRDREKKKGIAF